VLSFLNEGLLATLELSPDRIEEQTLQLKKKPDIRNRRFRGGGPPADVGGKTAVLVDAGLASGFTLKASIYCADIREEFFLRGPKPVKTGMI